MEGIGEREDLEVLHAAFPTFELANCLPRHAYLLSQFLLGEVCIFAEFFQAIACHVSIVADSSTLFQK